MDQIIPQPSPQMCLKHSQKKVEFVQVNDLTNSPNNPLFYCTTCINKDLSFKGINYLLVSQIIEDGEKNIIQKWPPVNDYSITDQLMNFTDQESSSNSIIHQINLYFTQLKEEFLKKIDLCEKKMINRALELPIGKESILKQYQEISQIYKLRSLLIQCEKQDTNRSQQNCREFITEIETQKETNSELLTNLLNQCNKREQLINFEYPNQIKKSIFSHVDEIDFFHSQSNPTFMSSNKSSSGNAAKLMRLIANRSNFCSTEFLSQLSAQIEKIDPFLSGISFENMHQKNQNPIDFSKLSQNRFNLIHELVEYSIALQENEELTMSINQKIQDIQYLNQIFDSSVIFMNDSLKEQLKEYLIDTYPFLKQVNFTNAIKDQDKFDCFRQLSEGEIQDIFVQNKSKKTSSRDKSPSQRTDKQISIEPNQKMKKGNLFDRVREYKSINNPIIQQNKKEQQVKTIEVKLIKTDLHGGNNLLEILNNKQVSVKKSNDNFVNCVSDIVLEKEKMYIFRFQIDHQKADHFYLCIGLMEKSKFNSQFGYENYLSCLLEHKSKKIQHLSARGIDTYQKGNLLSLDNRDLIEMRVWLSSKQLEILDYPNYSCQLGISDKYKQKLTDLNDLILYVGMKDSQINVTLTDASIVEEFPV